MPFVMGFPRMTVSDVLEVLEMIYDKPVDEKLIRALKLDQVLDREWQRLSTGYQKRLLVLSAFASGRKIVLLDEITNGLDVISAQVVLNTMRLYGRNHLVLFATHIFEHVEKVADRVINPA